MKGERGREKGRTIKRERGSDLGRDKRKKKQFTHEKYSAD